MTRPFCIRAQMLWLSLLVAIATTAGCASEAPRSSGNSALGITTFELAESTTTASVVGFGAGGDVVARIDLSRGHFTLSPAFADSPGEETDGRKLRIVVGHESMVWETRGDAPVLGLPIPASSDSMMIRFVADEHVGPVLEKWGIGFDLSHASLVRDTGVGAEQAYSGTIVACNAEGLWNTEVTCSGGSCAMPYHTFAGNTVCNGGSGTAQMTHFLASWPSTYQTFLQQCCANSGSPFYAEKTCCDSGTASCMSACGTGGGAGCAPCPQYSSSGAGCSGNTCTIDTVSTCSIYVGGTDGNNGFDRLCHSYTSSACSSSSCDGVFCGYPNPSCGGICTPELGCYLNSCMSWDGNQAYLSTTSCTATDHCGNATDGEYNDGYEYDCVCWPLAEPQCCNNNDCECGSICSNGSCVNGGCDPGQPCDSEDHNYDCQCNCD